MIIRLAFATSFLSDISVGDVLVYIGDTYMYMLRDVYLGWPA